MRFCKTFWENRQVLQALTKKLLPLSLTIPCCEAQCGLKETICLFHSFPVCSCILYRLLLIHICLRSKNTCAIPLHLLFVALPLSCIHPSLYICIWGTVGSMSTSFFHKISLGFSQENKTKVQIKTKKNTPEICSFCFFLKLTKKNTNHPFFHTPPNTHKFKPQNSWFWKLPPTPNRT